MTNETESAGVEVTQADREAAAALIETYWSGSDASMLKLAASYRAGHSQGVWARAFARHRTTAEAGKRELVEALRVLSRAFEWHMTQHRNLSRVVFSFDAESAPTEDAIRKLVATLAKHGDSA